MSWNADESCMIFTVSYKKLKRLMMDFTNVVLISTSTICTETGGNLDGPPYAMEYNENDQSQNLECRLFYMLK